jgi:hypothetical protein
VKERYGPPGPLDTPPGYEKVAEAVAGYAFALAVHPWLELFPMSLTAVEPMRRNEGWVVRDAAGDALPLARGLSRGWNLRALSGGQPLAVFGEWDGADLRLLSACADGRFYNLARHEP